MLALFLCAIWILISGQIFFDIVWKGTAPFFWFGKTTWLNRKDDSLHFYAASAYWIAIFFTSFGGFVWLSVQEFNGARPFYPETTTAILLTIISAVMFFGTFFLMYRRISDRIKRDSFKKTILMLADDTRTEPEYLSLQEVVDLYDFELIDDIIVELKKMPPGSRSFQRAQDITGADDYIRQA